MNADNDEIFVVFGFELFQIENDVDAVNTAVSPKIQQYDLAF